MEILYTCRISNREKYRQLRFSKLSEIGIPCHLIQWFQFADDAVVVSSQEKEIKSHVHGAIFRATCNAILLLRDVNMANTHIHYILLMYNFTYQAVCTNCNQTMQNHDIPEILFEQINKSLERPA